MEVVNALIRADVDVSFAEIEAEFGHDSFLMPVPRYLEMFGGYMRSITT